MAIENYSCEVCSHRLVCSIKQTIDKFSDEAKKPLGVDIEMKKCLSFDNE